jgi:hypothetical protein
MHRDRDTPDVIAEATYLHPIIQCDAESQPCLQRPTMGRKHGRGCCNQIRVVEPASSSDKKLCRPLEHSDIGVNSVDSS